MHNTSYHKRLKHIEIDCHVVCEKIESKLVKFFPINTKTQIADFLIKQLYKSAFEFHVSKLDLLNLHNPACGGVLHIGPLS